MNVVIYYNVITVVIFVVVGIKKMVQHLIHLEMKQYHLETNDYLILGMCGLLLAKMLIYVHGVEVRRRYNIN